MRTVSAALASVALFALAAAGLGLRASGAGEPGRTDARTTQAELSALREAYRRVDEALHPPENPYSPAKADLGQRLFFDTLLSGARTMSCAGCHVPTQSWSDGRPRGIGETGAAMKVRTPTLLDVAQNPILGWDGKFRDLEAVAFTPITGTNAMNLPEETLIARLKADPGYVRAFAAAFPDRVGAADPDGAISRRTVELALATFQRSIVSGEAPFDRWVAGDARAISPSAKAGFALFNGKAQCAACHSGWTFTDGSFHDIGVGTGADIGRAAFFPDSVQLRYAFKTPTLRDVAERGPYMHDGSLASLREVVDLYDRGGIDRPSRSPAIRPLGLTEAEKRDLIAFLKSLSADGTASVATPPRLN
ncbi:tryptophan tryptophylquinone biosynthesis enzyme MauG [Methylobacterium sp. Leaf104]|uniref:cytochrome-c peroxidase n=1 Tax=Methylobacterium TaxID=407 RepID=UPI0006FAA885|nr:MULTISPECIES: cytochrome c peroxidase [Methylobacterium]KQP30844.1 tryptophan tryptophylquinone biosynthesis enzyme MauG [Methylobacterium sp. Leaf104]MCI9882160.1 c-type cytochrome [Methylobacterium goesingense]